MKIGEMIALLNRVAAEVPDGLDTDVRVHICGGHDKPSINTQIGEVVPERQMNRAMTTVLAATAVITVHPHNDDTRTTSTPMTAGVDDELARMVSGDIAPAPAGGSAPPAVTYGGMKIPFTDEGTPITPGSPEAVARGCTCDPEKNNHGAGVDVDGDGDGDGDGDVHFICREACPVHRIDPPSGGISVRG